MSSLPYTCLDPFKSEIRILMLDPAPDDESPISCSLRIVSLDDNPAFEALSYVWGDPTVKKNCIVDGETFAATLNLHRALRHLRWRHEPRILWVDAVCINQDDIGEKNTQVPLMARIYSGASAVLSWLGPSNADVDAFAEWWQTPDSPERPPASGKAIEAACRGVDLLLHNAYWTRMWTFQECALSVNPPIYLCGRQEFSLRQLDLSVIMNRLGEELERYEQALEMDAKTGRELDLFEFDSLMRLFSKIMQDLRRHTGSGPAMVESLREEESRNMFSLLAITIGRQYSNNRDRIYGLYGMCPEIQSCWPVDYQKSLREITWEAASFMIDKLLGMGLYDTWEYPAASLEVPGSSRGEICPTWVPDLEKPVSLFTNVAKMEPTINSSGEFLPAVSKDLRTLTVFGVSFGRIKVLARFSASLPTIASELLNVLRTPDSPIQKDPSSLLSTLLPSEGSRTAWETPLPEILDALGDVASEKEAADSGEQPEELSGLKKALKDWRLGLRLLSGNALFMTDREHVGIASAAASDGDLVVGLWQQEYCSVLRGSNSGTTSGDFVMVGPAFIRDAAARDVFDVDGSDENGPMKFTII